MLNLNFTTIDKKLYQGSAKKVNVKTTNGYLTLLPNHQPIIAEIETSIVTVIDENDSENLFAVSSGYLFLNSNNNLNITVQTGENKNEINFVRAEQAKARILKLIEEKKYDKESLEYINLQRSLIRANNRIALNNKNE